MNSNNESTQIDVREIFFEVLKHWIPIAIIIVVFTAGGYIGGKMLIAPRYEAYVDLLINTREDASAKVTNDNVNSARNLVRTYAVLVKSNIVLDDVAEKAQVPYTYTKMCRIINCEQIDETQVMRVSAVSADKEEARRMIQTLSDDAPAILEEAAQAGFCEVVSKVIVNDEPVSASASTLGICAGFGAAVCCVVFIAIRMALKNSIADDRDSEEVLGLNVLGVIPDEPDRNEKDVISSAEHFGTKLINGDEASFAYIEAFKSLRANIEFLAKTESVKTIIVTSAIPSESKSTVAVNICLSLARLGKKVCLVDSDLRKPVLHKYLSLGKVKCGLSEVLSGDANLNDAMVRYVSNMYIIPVGQIPPNPSELLSQDRMARLVEFLKTKFDYIIFDAPPVTIVADAAELGRYADGALLVVRSKYAHVRSVQFAKKKLQDVGIRIFGTVITRFKTEKNQYRRSGYYYNYGYSKKGKYGYGYGSRYGYSYGDNTKEK